MRRAIIFSLVPIENLEEEAQGDANTPEGAEVGLPRDLAAFRRLARKGGAQRPANARHNLTNVRRRSAAVRAFDLARARVSVSATTNRHHSFALPAVFI